MIQYISTFTATTAVSADQATSSASIEKDSGDGQRQQRATKLLRNPLVVIVRDKDGLIVPNVISQFTTISALEAVIRSTHR